MIVCFLALLKVLQSWHHKRHRDNHSASQPSASDTQLSALLAGGGCPPELANIDKLPHTGQVGGGCPPQLTNVDDLPHPGQVSSVTHTRNIVKKSAARVIQDHPELCSVANVGTLAVKLARHSFFGDEVLRASSLTGKNGPPLNETQLELLQNFIRTTVVPSMSLEDFKKQLWPLCKSALSNCCKRIRANLKAKTKGITRPREQY